MIADYKTASGNNTADLDTEVKRLLKQGFQLHGNPYAGQDSGGIVLFQAMIKTDNDIQDEQEELRVKNPETLRPRIRTSVVP